MSHHSLIEYFKRAGLIVQSREIKVVLFNQTNTKSIINEALRTKHGQVIVTDDKRSISMNNMTVCFVSNKPQAISDYPLKCVLPT